MPEILDAFGRYLSYLMVAAGVVWLALLFVTSAVFLIWPAAACIVGGILWKVWPEERLSWAWVTAATATGLLLSGYQALASVPLLSGIFSSVAAISLPGFLVFAALHAVLLYSSNAPAKASE